MPIAGQTRISNLVNTLRLADYATPDCTAQGPATMGGGRREAGFPARSGAPAGAAYEFDRRICCEPSRQATPAGSSREPVMPAAG